MAGLPPRAVGRRLALRHARTDRRPAVVTVVGTDQREGVPLTVVQRQLGHANLGITSIYLQGIDNSEIINTVFARPAPMLPASAGLR
jgi:hypothetical protein